MNFEWEIARARTVYNYNYSLMNKIQLEASAAKEKSLISEVSGIMLM